MYHHNYLNYRPPPVTMHLRALQATTTNTTTSIIGGLAWDNSVKAGCRQLDGAAKLLEVHLEIFAEQYHKKGLTVSRASKRTTVLISVTSPIGHWFSKLFSSTRISS